jgi:hypothetical protein
VAILLAGLVLGAGGVVGLELLLAARDKSGVSADQGPGRAYADQGDRHLRPGERPGVAYDSNPPTSGPHVHEAVTRDATTLSDDALLSALEAGNVVLAYGTPRPPAALRSLQASAAGPFDPELVDAGQAVLLARRPGLHGFVALAWRHAQATASPDDPALRAFADYWLGRASP